ncbi:MAG: hypothetical protein V1911_04440 [Candidatus Micrarchaeota archaeon]
MKKLFAIIVLVSLILSAGCIGGTPANDGSGTGNDNGADGASDGNDQPDDGANSGAGDIGSGAGDVTSPDFDPTSFGSPHSKVPQTNIGPCCSHPYYHKTYRAFSDDGVQFQKENVLIRDKASVPDIFRQDDGTYILYFVDGSYDTMDCVVSHDSGETFEYGDCTIYGFTESKAWDPEVVKTDGGYYRMYFFAPDMEQMGSAGVGSEGNRIMSAVSKDGINWLQESGVRFEHDGVLDPAVIKIGDKWKMYTWYMVGEMDSTVVIATSDDGINFAEEKEIDIGGGIPEIIENNGKYQLFFCGNGIEFVTSDDGVNWNNDAATALQPDEGKITCDPTLAETDDGWVLYYKTQ